MIIDCISDLHGHFPTLEGGDLLIIAGDLTARHTLKELDKFNEWVRVQDYKKKVLIAGNHDTFFETGVFYPDNTIYNAVLVDPSVHYLCDSGTEYEGLKIWGSPWTAQFPGINPNCCAFTVRFGCDTDYWLGDCWDLIPSDTDILVTHSPPFGILDQVKIEGEFLISEPPIQKVRCTGSKSLNEAISRVNPKLIVFGHIHEMGGQLVDLGHTKFVNASLVNEFYQPVNKPVRIVL